MRRFLLLTMTTLLAACVLAPLGHAATKYKVAVGLGDQSASMFSNADFKALKVKKARYFIPWDAAKHADQLTRADDYVNAAKKAKVKVFMHISTADLRAKKGHLPSVAEYKTYVGKLVKRYKAKGVTDWGTWNEENHKSQETWDNPKRAAQFFLAMKSMCKGCHVVALDVLDQAGDTRYIARWFAALGKKNYSKATIFGIHNYSDTNRNRSTGTSRILKKIKSYRPKADFWLTETGGLAGFGRSFPCSLTRQVKSVKYMFTLTKKFRSDITRLYSYNFYGTTDAQCKDGLFDAGLVEADGSKRPAFATFKSQAASFTR